MRLNELGEKSHVHMTYYFLELLIYLVIYIYVVDILVFRGYFSSYRRNIACEYKLHRKPIIKYKQTFSLVSDTDVEKTCFLKGKLKLLMNNFYEQPFADVLQNRCS